MNATSKASMQSTTVNDTIELEDQDLKDKAELGRSVYTRENGIIKYQNKTKIGTSSDINQPLKRTRCRPNGKSIIQNAIARKEQSFGIYDKPKSRCLIGKQEQQLLRKPILPKKKRHVKRCLSQTKNTSFNEDEKSPQQETETADPIFTAKLMSRLCKCTENKQIYMESESDSQFCSAIDSLNDKLIGCSRLVDVRTVPMFRPSSKIPFGIFCESHRQRLMRHNCCPTCGVFCTQGTFSECPHKHHFHRDCKLSLEEKDYCPHCGDTSPTTDILITMHTSKIPTFMPVQKSHHAVARIGICNSENNSCFDIKKARTSSFLLSFEKMEEFRDKMDINPDECNTIELIKAVENCDTKKVVAIVESGNVDMKIRLNDSNNGTFLHLAVSKGNLEIVYVIISVGIDLDALDNDQQTALMLATSLGKNDIVRCLVKSGVDLTLRGIDGMSCLHVAAKCGNLDACKILLESGFDTRKLIDSQDDGGWTSLVWACEHGHVDVVRYLIRQGSDTNLRDVEHNVALHWAAFKGFTEIVELLLNTPVDIDALNIHGDTALHMSARDDHYGCVLLLLSRKADLSIVNRNDETPLDCAPKDGMSFIPLALNAQLRDAVGGDLSRQRSVLVNDISKGRELNPIQCCNTVDAEREPSNFTYIKRNCTTSENVQTNMNAKNLRSCTCNDDCKSSECECAKLSIKCWYDDQGKLLPDFNFYDPPLIFECNDMCSCNAILCTNRLVQKPLTQRFQLFKTQSKGWGVKSLGSVARGNYVGEYVGEILTDMEADAREDDSYLFDLDNRETDSFCIDAKYYGNFARFINHSCDPNLHPIKVFIEHHDLRFPRIALFAKKNIAPGEELSFDYGEKFWLVKCKSFTCECQIDCCKYSKETIGQTLEKHQAIL